MDSERERCCIQALVKESEDLAGGLSQWTPGRVPRTLPLKRPEVTKPISSILHRNQSSDPSISRLSSLFRCPNLIQKPLLRRGSLNQPLFVPSDLSTSSVFSQYRPPVARIRCVTRKNRSQALLQTSHWAWNIPNRYRLPPLRRTAVKLPNS